MTKQKIIRIVGVVLVIVIVVLLIWFLYLYPRKVFKDNERILDEAGKRYYQINRAVLPSDEGRVVSVSLNTLVKQKYLEGFYIPYSNKVCDLNESNVKVVKKDGEYVYYTYLKCGKYESNVDHDGPVIELNGDKKVTISLGDTYKELGVKSVKDNVDGDIAVSNVKIEGNVDTSKTGTYEITYTVSDSLGNKSEVIRKVIVEELFSDVVKSDTANTNNYYIGNALNNYVMFNNMLFRIIKINSDNTVVIASDELLANVDYTNNGRFSDSSLDSWLNDYFYKLLDEKYQDLIVSSKWCDDVISTDNYLTKECTRTSSKKKVGILSIQDYNNTLNDGVSFLDYEGIVWYSNFDSNNNPWTLTSLFDYPLKSEPMSQDSLFNVRPAVTLKSNTKILDGDGTISNPYILVENESGRRNSKINERQIGEYVYYSGYTFRISNITGDNTTEIIMTDVLKNDGVELSIGYNNDDNVYNPNKKGNLGYQVVNEMTSYISTKLFEKTKVEVPIYKNKVTYNGKKNIKSYNNLITIPSTFDIFTGKGNDSSDGGYWYIDSSNERYNKTVMNPVGTVNYTDVTDDWTAGIKVKAYLKDDVFITDGDGTLTNPYKVSN